MAVSSSIGSNIFDVLVGLPLPWLVYSIWQGSMGNAASVVVEAGTITLSVRAVMLVSRYVVRVVRAVRVVRVVRVGSRAPLLSRCLPSNSNPNSIPNPSSKPNPNPNPNPNPSPNPNPGPNP